MENTNSGPESRGLRHGLRERLNQANAVAALPAETLAELTSLPNRLNEATARTTNELEGTAERITRTLRTTTAQTLQQIEAVLTQSHQRLAERQRIMTQTERDLAHTVEMLRRQADRTGWMQTGVIMLALAAGTLGGAAAALLILDWLQ